MIVWMRLWRAGVEMGAGKEQNSIQVAGVWTEVFENRGSAPVGSLGGDLLKRIGMTILLEKCPVDF